MNHLEQKYEEVVILSPTKKFNYKSVMGVPYADKIAINMGIGETVSNSEMLGEAVAKLAQITGQVPVITRVKESIANFKLHEGMPIGCKVALRKERTYNFMDKLMNTSLLRVYDFHGISVTPFDGRGSYVLGIKEQLILPEIDYDKISKVRGMNVAIVTTANTNEEAKALPEEIGMPLKR